MRVLVTGGAGFIGSRTVDLLIKRGNEVAIIDNLSTGCSEDIHDSAYFYEEDIRSSGLANIFENWQPECVFHFAAQIDISKSVAYPVLDADINVLGTLNVLDACIKAGVRKIIYSSSAAVYGNPLYLGINEQHEPKPISNYGLSKLMPEHYIRLYNKLYGLEYSILRYSNVYGWRRGSNGEGGVVSKFCENITAGKQPVIYGSGRQTRDFVYVDDVVLANIQALERGNDQTFNIGVGTSTSINELFQIIAQLLNSTVQPKYESAALGDIRDSYFIVEKANILLKWRAQVDLLTGLQKTIQQYLA